MKIGFFTECYKPVVNGVSISVEIFKKALEKKGHQVFIFAPDNDEAEPEERVYRLPAISTSGGKLYPIILPSVDLQKAYLPEDVIKELDIIHAQHMFTAGRLARYAARKYDKPLIYTYHTLIAEYTHYAGILAGLARFYLINMSKRFCNSCDQVITPSESMKKILLKYGINTPIEVVMTGIDIKAYKRASGQASKQIKDRYKIPGDKKILLYLSRIAKEKNIGFLLRAIKKIIGQYSNCHLLMVGGGPEEEWLKTRIEQDRLQDTVTATGMLPKVEANKMFGIADLFVFPSCTETQGLVVAEAMASGAPPVAVDKMGPSDLIHDGKDGFLTKLTISDFSEKVLKLLHDDKLRDKFANEGMRRVEEFSNETSTAKLISLYEKVLQGESSTTQEVDETLSEGIAHL